MDASNRPNSEYSVHESKGEAVSSGSLILPRQEAPTSLLRQHLLPNMNTVKARSHALARSEQMQVDPRRQVVPFAGMTENYFWTSAASRNPSSERAMLPPAGCIRQSSRLKETSVIKSEAGVKRGYIKISEPLRGAEPRIQKKGKTTVKNVGDPTHLKRVDRIGTPPEHLPGDLGRGIVGLQITAPKYKNDDLGHGSVNVGASVFVPVPAPEVVNSNIQAVESIESDRNDEEMDAFVQSFLNLDDYDQNNGLDFLDQTKMIEVPVYGIGADFEGASLRGSETIWPFNGKPRLEQVCRMRLDASAAEEMNKKNFH